MATMKTKEPKQELLPAANNRLVVLQPYDKQIDELIEQYGGLDVKGPDDKEGIQACHEARMIFRKVRIEVDKLGKELREEAVKFQKDCIAETKRIIGRIEPVEEALQEKEDTAKREKERIEKEKAEALKKLVKERFDELRKYGAAEMPVVIEQWTDEEYAARLATAKADYDRKTREAEEQNRLRKEQEAELALQRAEAFAIRKQQEAQAAELKRQQDELAAERKKIEDAKQAELRKQQEAEREKQRQAELEQEKAKAAERAAQAERERIEREQREAKEKAEREERERLEEEAAKPERDKIRSIADEVSKIAVPQIKRREEVRLVLDKCVKELMTIARKR